MKKFVKIFYVILGFGFVGLGWLGAILPGLPTVVFMILALACFAKSSDRFHSWLYNHSLFGEQLQQWDKYRVIPPIAKGTAVISMAASGAYIVIFTEISMYIYLPIFAVMVLGLVYIFSKPSYPPG